MQQGRVQLDADWNEQGAILLRYLRQLAADTIGPHGGPAGHAGFAIAPLPTPEVLPTDIVDFAIGDGHYYVDGVLCELAPAAADIVRLIDKTKVEVAAWTVDGRAFASGQYVELFDADNPAAPRVAARIAAADHPSRTLTLSFAPSPDFEAKFKAGTRPQLRRVTTYLTQPDLASGAKLADGSYQVYLDVWGGLRHPGQG